ncbi:ubiquitin fusion degradation protein ufd1 protein [Pelomyxa schiedti]|nr:ubiquitin fusion degradation protein ufd1 protein [Pelomyxa schiedti]
MGDRWVLRCIPPVFVEENTTECRGARFEHGNRLRLPASLLERFFGRPDSGYRSGNRLGSSEPILFSVRNTEIGFTGDRGQIVCGALDFVTPEGRVVVPKWIMTYLWLQDDSPVELTYLRRSLPRARQVSLKPVHYSFYENITNPRRYLEEHLTNYSTLTQGSTISVGDETRFFDIFVQKCTPEGTVNIVNSDVELVLEEPITQQPNPSRRLEVATPMDGEVKAGDYSYFSVVVPEANATDTLRIECQAISGDPDIYVSADCQKPSRLEYTWSGVTTGGEEIEIPPNQRDPQNRTFFISVYGYSASTFKIAAYLETKEEQSELRKSGLASRTMSLRSSSSSSHDGMSECPNCGGWVPQLSFERHTAFCARNNWKCPVCSLTMPAKDRAAHVHCTFGSCKKLMDPNHGHCPDCSMEMAPIEITKHHEIYHTPLQCTCSAKYTLEDMRIHKQYECRLREEPCQWCAEKITVELLPHHQSECQNKTVPCERCGKLISHRDIKHHLETHSENEIPPSILSGGLGTSGEWERIPPGIFHPPVTVDTSLHPTASNLGTSGEWEPIPPDIMNQAGTGYHPPTLGASGEWEPIPPGLLQQSDSSSPPFFSPTTAASILHRTPPPSSLSPSNHPPPLPLPYTDMFGAPSFRPRESPLKSSDWTCAVCQKFCASFDQLQRHANESPECAAILNS